MEYTREQVYEIARTEIAAAGGPKGFSRASGLCLDTAHKLLKGKARLGPKVLQALGLRARLVYVEDNPFRQRAGAVS